MRLCYPGFRIDTIFYNPAIAEHHLAQAVGGNIWFMCHKHNGHATANVALPILSDNNKQAYIDRNLPTDYLEWASDLGEVPVSKWP